MAPPHMTYILIRRGNVAREPPGVRTQQVDQVRLGEDRLPTLESSPGNPTLPAPGVRPAALEGRAVGCRSPSLWSSVPVG